MTGGSLKQKFQVSGRKKGEKSVCSERFSNRSHYRFLFLLSTTSYAHTIAKIPEIANTASNPGSFGAGSVDVGVGVGFSSSAIASASSSTCA